MNTQPTQAKRRVLIVDDNSDAAVMLSICLTAYGHETAVAFGGAEGIKLAEAFQPQVVILDLGMPQMSGFDVAIALRRIPHLRSVYIAALTGWNDLKTRERVIAAGFNKHLTKPSNVAILLDLVEHADV